MTGQELREKIVEKLSINMLGKNYHELEVDKADEKYRNSMECQGCPRIDYCDLEPSSRECDATEENPPCSQP